MRVHHGMAVLLSGCLMSSLTSTTAFQMFDDTTSPKTAMLARTRRRKSISYSPQFQGMPKKSAILKQDQTIKSPPSQGEEQPRRRDLKTQLSSVGMMLDGSTLGNPEGLNALETFWIVQLEEWYNKALAMKCPFLRRRYTDVVELLEKIVRSIIIHPTHHRLLGPPLSCRASSFKPKTRGLSLSILTNLIRQDWKEVTGKGYYVTGKLNTTLYRDDCYFDGPDPDMPIHGLRKYQHVASLLFDRKRTSCQLLDIQYHNDNPIASGGRIVAAWCFRGVLHLPWFPTLPVVHGKTTYYIDDQGLIYKHVEDWDISAIEAFTKTCWCGTVFSKK